MSDSETQEEAYILERKEISVDDDEIHSIKSIDDSDLEQDVESEGSDDLDDFNKLKAKTVKQMEA